MRETIINISSIASFHNKKSGHNHSFDHVIYIFITKLLNKSAIVVMTLCKLLLFHNYIQAL